jgi:hypothetical protein
MPVVAGTREAGTGFGWGGTGGGVGVWATPSVPTVNADGGTSLGASVALAIAPVRPLRAQTPNTNEALICVTICLITPAIAFNTPMNSVESALLGDGAESAH